MGSSIENNHLIAGLFDKIEELDKCEVILKQKVKHVKPALSDAELPEVVLEDGRIYRPKLLVGSDGVNSIVRNSYGVKSSGYSY
jgi:2-polyprenyl-6-methoxyphenol hydroxylase-like FAD-dependent oxidoreductase